MPICARDGCDQPLSGAQAKWCSERCRSAARWKCDPSHRAWHTARAKRPERRAQQQAYMAEYWQRPTAREAARARNYGITVERLRELLAAGCAACGAMDDLHVDHDHSCCPGSSGGWIGACGRCVRGVLCRSCNTTLGFLESDRAPALREYLARYATAQETA